MHGNTNSMSLGSRLLRVPSEIIDEIFTNACAVDFEDLPYDITTPLTLGAVCKTWRDIVWSIARLWSTIVLRMTFLTLPSQLKLLDLWFQNSLNRPLSIYFDSGEKSFEMTVMPLQVALKKIMEQCERWEHLDICVLGDEFGEFIKTFRQVRGRVPLLRKAHLRPFENGIIRREPLDMFEIAPQLRSFSLSILYLDDVKIPWTQLTSFRARLPAEECVEALYRCKNLQSCTYTAIFYEKPSEYTTECVFSFPATQTIDIPHLTSLSIINTDYYPLTIILRYITCPALREFHLGASVVTPDPGSPMHLWDSFEEFLQRSAFPLEVLDMETYSFNDSLFSMLNRLPTITRLSLRQESKDAFLSGSLIEQLDFSPDKEVLLPNLTEMHYFMPNVTINIHRIVEVLRKRWNACVPGVSRLKVFDLKIDLLENDSKNSIFGVDSTEVVREFKDLLRDGMHISIMSEHGVDLLKAHT